MEEVHLLGKSKLSSLQKGSELLPSSQLSSCSPYNVAITARSCVNVCFLLLAGAAKSGPGAGEGGGPSLIGSMDAAPAGGLAVASGSCAHVRILPTDFPSRGIVVVVSLALLTCCHGVKIASRKRCPEGVLLRKGLGQEPLRLPGGVALPGCCSP